MGSSKHKEKLGHWAHVYREGDYSRSSVEATRNYKGYSISRIKTVIGKSRKIKYTIFNQKTLKSISRNFDTMAAAKKYIDNVTIETKTRRRVVPKMMRYPRK